MKTTLPILFSSGSATVAREYKLFLKKLAAFLKPYDVKVLVNGYADTVPIKSKKYPSNFELGAARAANIVHQLVRSGLKPAVFKIASPGEYRFAAKEMSKQKSFERRAEVTVIFSG
jgi:chemotaxis protein MotB